MDLESDRDLGSDGDDFCDLDGGHFELFGIAKLAERVHH